MLVGNEGPCYVCAMLRRPLVVLAAALGLASTAGAVPVADRITPGNAAAHLFGGSDAAGGIDDWYISNGVVEAIVDDVGVQTDLLPLLGVATPAKQSVAARSGGTLVDVGLVGRDNDQFGQLFTVAGLSSSNLVVYRQIAAATDGDTATVTVTGIVPGFEDDPAPIPAEDLEIVTTYTAAGSEPFLTITTTITNRHPTNAAGTLVTMLDPIIWTQRGIVPFTPLPERGFRHGILDLANPFAALETQVLFAAGPGNLGPDDGPLDPLTGKPAGEVAYGLLPGQVSIDLDGDGGNPPLVSAASRLGGISNNTTTAFGVLPPPGATGLPPGGVLRSTRRLYVGGRNDVASVTNRMLPVIAEREGFATGTISGIVTRADGETSAASIIATRTGGPTIPFAAGTPVTQVRAGDDGVFSGVVLPAGTYDLVARTPERPAVTVSGVTVTAGMDTRVTVPPFISVGAVQLRALEIRRGRDRPLPVRVVFTGVRGTTDPVFRRFFDASLFDAGGRPETDLRPETFAGGPAQGNTVLVGTEPVTVQVHAGTYELLATRGPEYSVQRLRVKVKPRRRTRVAVRLRRVVNPPDALSADFHVHSGRSFDASAPLRDRVTSFAAEGVEVMVATDHDVHTDYAPIIATLQLGAHIASIVGNEVTTAVTNPPSFEASVGHLNGWPVRFDQTARKRGAIEDEFVAPNVIYSRLRAQGATVVQYNHPRDTLSGLTSLGFFTNIGYDPDKRLDEAPNDVLLDRDVLGPGRTGVSNPDGYRNLDFDTIEVANGLSVPSYLAVRRDWLSLLNQTDFTTVPFIAGTAVSDSHRLTVETPGYFRTYVRGVGDDPARLDLALFNARVKAGAMTGTNGPIVSAHVEGDGGAAAGPGETLRTTSGAATLVITVDAAPWIPVDQVRVIANGFGVRTFDATSAPAVRPAPRNRYSRSTRGVRRFSARLPLTVAQDTYLIIEAGAPLDPTPATPEPLARLVPGLVPIAFTNPIFIDRNADDFTPPGLPVMATATGGGEPLPPFTTVAWGDGNPVRTTQRSQRVPDASEQRTRHARARLRHTAEYFPLFALRLPADLGTQPPTP